MVGAWSSRTVGSGHGRGGGSRLLRQCFVSLNRSLGTSWRALQFICRKDMLVRAMVIPNFGGPDLFEERDVERPEPGVGEVLVRVIAAFG